MMGSYCVRRNAGRTATGEERTTALRTATMRQRVSDTRAVDQEVGGAWPESDSNVGNPDSALSIAHFRGDGTREVIPVRRGPFDPRQPVRRPAENREVIPCSLRVSRPAARASRSGDRLRTGAYPWRLDPMIELAMMARGGLSSLRAARPLAGGL